jgi:photosystem II stability/assembly factor-like uncharacterized protein
MRIDDVSPTVEGSTLALPGLMQSVSGKALCIATSIGGNRAYLGGHSGVWRSDDGGATWRHLTRSQPAPGQTAVPGALMVPNVYDVLVSPADEDIVFAATGRDPRRPALNGVYRSTNGGTTWTRVHQFVTVQGGVSTVRNVGCLAVAPDNPLLVYAAGQSAVGISSDGGVTWVESVPQQSPGQIVNLVAVGPQTGAIRHVYAVGSRVWHSTDGGQAWQEDPVALSLGFPSDTLGTCARALAIHPGAPTVIYLNSNGNLFRGNFSGAGAAVWTQLPPVPVGFPSTTASGTDYIVAHVTPEGQLLLFASDRRSAHVAVGEPASTSDWRRIDGNPVHVDPHGLALTPNFRLLPAGPSGRIYMVNDGGVVFSVDGAASWQKGRGLSTLGLVNAAVLPRAGAQPSICIGTGDNNGFFTADGGTRWKTQEYLGGDNDACFADPLQPNRLIVFAPRTGLQGIFLYRKPPGGVPDGAVGTSDKIEIPGPPPRVSGETNAGWNGTSAPYNLGYRPLVLTLRGEAPRPDGDFVTIIYSGARASVARTTAMSSIGAAADWISTASAEGPGVKVFQQGPDLPTQSINVAQAAGGHASPSLFAGDPGGSQGLWTWSAGMAAWRRLVPAGPGAGPSAALRFFVSPYDARLLYVVDRSHVWRSTNGGTIWVVDASLEAELTEGGAFPFEVPADGNPGLALLRDMLFDAERPGYRFAVGVAGVFYTLNGQTWDHLIRSSAMPMRANNASYDPVSDPCGRALYVSTNNRGILRLAPLPPEWDHPLGAVVAAEGRITLLRVHDVGTRFGPPSDSIDAEVIVMLDTEPEKAFGFQLRADADEEARLGLLDELRDAFNKSARIRLEYTRTGCRTGTVFRVIRT